jgi:hypothetical protein
VVALHHVDRLATETGDLVDPEAREDVARLVGELARVAGKAAAGKADEPTVALTRTWVSRTRVGTG